MLPATFGGHIVTKTLGVVANSASGCPHASEVCPEPLSFDLDSIFEVLFGKVPVALRCGDEVVQLQLTRPIS